MRQTETTGGLEEITLAALKGQDAVGRQRERGARLHRFHSKGLFLRSPSGYSDNLYF